MYWVNIFSLGELGTTQAQLVCFFSYLTLYSVVFEIENGLLKLEFHMGDNLSILVEVIQVIDRLVI